MSQAFDRLDRRKLFLAMIDADIPAPLCHAVLAWHQNMHYHLKHAAAEGSVASTIGVRQGCKVAPLLWVIYSCYFYKQASALIDAAWLRSNTSFFADDLHFFTLARCTGDLDLFLSRCSILFELLLDFNMLINYKKSALLLRLKGSAAKKWKHRHLVRAPGQDSLRIRVAKQHVLLPIKQVHKYLGVMLSYISFEKETVRYRMQQCAAAFSRLRRVLTSKSGLRTSDRVRLWTVCVRTCLLYGLDNVPLTPSLAAKLRVQCTRQIRAIARSPVHLTRETTEQLFARLSVKDTLVVLCEMLPGRDDSLTQCSVTTVSLAWTLRVREACLRCIPAVGSATPSVPAQNHHGVLLPVEDTGPSVACPCCGLYFKGHAAVKIHAKRKHPDIDLSVAQSFHKVLHGVDGMPTCAQCGALFQSWQSLAQHVQDGHCHGPRMTCLSASLPDRKNVPLIHMPEIVSLAQTEGWRGLVSNATVRCAAMHFCPLCNQWCVNAMGIKVHLQDQHPEWQQVHMQLMTMGKLLKRSIVKPCRFCGLKSFDKARHAGRCPVVVASILLEYVVRHGWSNSSGDGCLLPGPCGKRSDAPSNGTRRGVSACEAAPRGCVEVREEGMGQRQGPKGTSACHANAESASGQASTNRTRSPHVPGETLPSTRRPAVHAEARHVAAPLASVGGSGDHHASDVGSQQGVEAAEGQPPSAAECFLACHNASLPHPSSSDESSRGHGGRAEGQGGPGERGPEWGQGLAVPDLGSGHGGHDQEGNPQACRSPPNLGQHRKSQFGAVSAPFPCQATGAAAPGGTCSLRDRSGTSGPRGSGNVPRTGRSVPLLSIDTRGCEATQGSAATVHVGPEGSADATVIAGDPTLLPAVVGNACAQADILTCVFSHERTHTCASAWLQGMLWVYAVLQRPLPQSLSRVWQHASLHRLTGHGLLLMREWQLLLGEWRRSPSHHYAAFLLLFQTHLTGIHLYAGEWQIRTASGGRVARSSSRSTSHGLCVRVPLEQLSSLQECVEAWHYRSECAALAQAPWVLGLYLLPQPAEGGANCKALSETAAHASKYGVDWSAKCFHMPLFKGSDTIDVQYVTYRIVAVGLHFGTLKSGHFRALLCDGEDMWLTCENGVASQCQLTAGHMWHTRFLWCLRMS